MTNTFPNDTTSSPSLSSKLLWSNLTDGVLWQAELTLEPLDQQLANSATIRVIGVQGVGSIDVAMEERSTAQAGLIIRLVDDPVLSALEPLAGPVHDHVATVDDVDILQRLDRQPSLLVLDPDLKTMLAGLLEKDGDTAEVIVGSDAELAGKSGGEGRVADHLHLDHGTLGELLHDGEGVAEGEQEDLPDELAEMVRGLVVFPDGVAELVVGDLMGPDVGAVEAVVFGYGVFATNVVCLQVTRE